MSASSVVSHSQQQAPQTALRKVVIAGLLGNVLVNTTLQVFVVRSLIVPLTIIMAVTVVVAGIGLTRWRWAPLVAAVWCVVAVIPGLAPYTYNLLHPAELGTFIGTVLGLGLYLVAIVAGLAATVMGVQSATAGRAPRWLSGFLIGLAAFCLGASLVAVIPPPDATTGVSAEALAQLPPLVSTQMRFEPKDLRVKVGETVALRLENRDPQRHYFDIDELNVHVAMPPGKSALALFRPTKPGTYTFYCSVPGHREAGMVGTLIVEP